LHPPASGRSSPNPIRSVPLTSIRCSLLILGAFGVVLAGVASPLFDLDRYSLSKELVLHATALASAATLASAWRRLEPGIVDALLFCYLAWSAMSALSAENGWLALRAFAVSVSGFVLWIAARSIARDGMGHRLVAGVGAAAALAAVLAAAQAYGLDL
jgi:hypothetical protein